MDGELHERSPRGLGGVRLLGGREHSHADRTRLKHFRPARKRGASGSDAALRVRVRPCRAWRGNGRTAAAPPPTAPRRTPARGRSPGGTRGGAATHRGRNFELNWCSDLIWKNRSIRRRNHACADWGMERSAPSSMTSRNAAKFSEMTRTSLVPGPVDHLDDHAFVDAGRRVGVAAHRVERERLPGPAPHVPLERDRRPVARPAHRDHRVDLVGLDQLRRAPSRNRVPAACRATARRSRPAPGGGRGRCRGCAKDLDLQPEALRLRDELPHPPHRPPLERERLHVDQRLVADVERLQAVAFVDLQRGRPSRRGPPAAIPARRTAQELLHRGLERRRLADRVAARQPHAAEVPVRDRGHPVGREHVALVHPQRERVERVAVRAGRSSGGRPRVRPRAREMRSASGRQHDEHRHAPRRRSPPP